jgi:hypothetical protein
MRYITRDTATHGDEKNILLYNLKELEGKDYRETKTNLISYAESHLDDEATRPRKGTGEARTHYRAVLSFDRFENSTKVKELTEKWLETNFKGCRAVATVHRDTDRTHIHVWLEARKLDEHKLNLDKKQFRNLDTSWAKIYAREYGEHYLTDHLKKKEATRAAKIEYAKGNPSNFQSKKPSYKVDFKKREERNYDKVGVGVHQRNPTNEVKVLSESKRAINDRAAISQRASREIDHRIRNGERTIRETSNDNKIRAQSVQGVNRIYGQSRELARGMERNIEFQQQLQQQQQQQQEPTTERTMVRERERVRERIKE